jgi:hypothetical protein
MVLTRADDFPIHQTPEPVAFSGTDRNFYDRYFFNGYAGTEGDPAFFAVAFGVYPHLNIADASFTLIRDGVETALHASRWLNMERMDLSVGPISIEVVEPLQVLQVKVEAPEQGLRADLRFEARSAPIEEPRFVRRQGPRTFMDYTRLTQNGRYRGWIELDGIRTSVDGFVGTRDRSWGVRPVGSRDSQDLAPPEPPQFFWLWSPCSFADGSFFFHANDDASGRPWNTRAVFSPDGCGQDEHQHFDFPKAKIEWKSGTRHARSAVVDLDDRNPSAGQVRFTPVVEFFMLGLGYTHPQWGHGVNHGALAVEREDLVLASLDRKLPHHLHIQALCETVYVDAQGRTRKGRGILEQLAIGPHAPSGFSSLLDMAP